MGDGGDGGDAPFLASKNLYPPLELKIRDLSGQEREKLQFLKILLFLVVFKGRDGSYVAKKTVLFFLMFSIN